MVPVFPLPRDLGIQIADRSVLLSGDFRPRGALINSAPWARSHLRNSLYFKVSSLTSPFIVNIYVPYCLCPFFKTRCFCGWSRFVIIILFFIYSYMGDCYVTNSPFWITLPSETVVWQPEFTDKILSRKTGAVQHILLNGYYTFQSSNEIIDPDALVAGLKLG